MALSSQENSEKHQYSEPWEDSDVVLIVEDEKFYVHSNILGFASPVFKAMLSSNFKEGREKVINLPGKSKTTVLAMLNLIYPIGYRITNYSSCKALLEISKEYSMKEIVLHVDDFMNEKVSCSLDVLKLADTFHLDKTKKKTILYFIKLMDSRFVRNWKGNWSDVSEKTKLEIICGKINVLTIGQENCACGYNSFCNHKATVSTWQNVRSLIHASDALKNA